MSADLALWPAVAGTLVALVAAVVAMRHYAELRASTVELERAIAARDANATPNESSFDVFLSYASPDDEFVESLARALQDQGLRVWYPRDQLKPGANITETIADGLARSRYGVVVLSPAFFRGSWPQKELGALTSRESQGEEVILPIWHGVDLNDVRAHAAPLADKLAMNGDTETMQEMASKIATVAGGEHSR